MKNITIVAASNGNNLKLANEIQKYCDGFSTKLIDLVDLNLPIYTFDAEGRGVPQEALELAETFIKSDGIVFVSPEYNMWSSRCETVNTFQVLLFRS